MCREYVHNWHISMLILWRVLLAAASYWALHGRWLPSHYYSRVSFFFFYFKFTAHFFLFEPRFYAYVNRRWRPLRVPEEINIHTWPFLEGSSSWTRFTVNLSATKLTTFILLFQDILLVRNFCLIRTRVIFRIFLFIFFFFYFPASSMNSIKVKIVDKTTERVNKVKKIK